MEQGNRDQFEKTEAVDPKAEQLKNQNKLLTDLWKLKQPDSKVSDVSITTRTWQKLHVQIGQMKNYVGDDFSSHMQYYKPSTFSENTWYINVEGAGQSYNLTFQKWPKVIFINHLWEERTLSEEEANKIVGEIQKNVDLLQAKKTQEKKKEFKSVIDSLAKQDSENADDILQMLT